MDLEKVNLWLTEIEDRTALIRTEVNTAPPEPVPPGVLVPAGGNLQAALDQGGAIELAEQAMFTGAYRVGVTGTQLAGRGGNQLTADGAPALDVRLGTRDVILHRLALGVTRSEIVVLAGRNTTDQTPENMPTAITLSNLFIPSHRGKRGIEFNASGRIADCAITDLYDPEKIENQAVWIANTLGDVVVENCHLEASSQSLMIGGDTDRMPGGPVRNVTIRKCVCTKPLAWKGNTNIPVKTLLEFKDGVGVLVEDCELSNCWKAGQDGYAIVATPRRGGVVDVKLRNLKVSNVGAIANITGFDDPYPQQQQTRITFEGGEYATNSRELGGRGCFALITNGPQEVRILGLQCDNDGSSFLLIGDGDPLELLEVRGCTFRYGTYGIFINGHADGDNSAGVVQTMIVEGNTISGAKAAFKARWPNNTYV